MSEQVEETPADDDTAADEGSDTSTDDETAPDESPVGDE